MLTPVLTRLSVLGGVYRRSWSVAERNVAAVRSYWVFFLTGFLEPLLYLLSIGFGLGARIGDMPIGGGVTVPYATFVAPAMLAASIMGGSLAETTIAFYDKWKDMRLYDVVVSTPVRPVEVALGELAWTVARGAVYATGFLLITVAMRITEPTGALLALPASLLVAVMFGGLGLLLTTFFRSFADLYIVNTVQFALFLFAGTFVPVSAYPAFLGWIVRATPLYHAVALVRGLATGHLTAGLLVNLAYVVAVAAVALWFAGRRMNRLLRG
jgi:lipooligosaccharide transport system permease protein